MKRQHKHNTSDPKERGTPERLAKVESVHIDAAGVQRVSSAPLDALRNRYKLISQDHFEAGNQYYDDFHKAGFDRSRVSDPERIIDGFGPQAPGFLSCEFKEQAWKRFVAADEVLAPFPFARRVVRAVIFAGPDISWTEIAIMLSGKKDPNQAKSAVLPALKDGLSALNFHYSPPSRGRIQAKRSERFTVNFEMHERAE
jgi:hypothetical protein